MSDRQRLVEAFASGALIQPSADTLNTIDLSMAIAGLCGAPSANPTAGAARIAAMIGNPEHLVFVLADGLGLSLLERLPETSFLRRRLAATLLAVYPSTTAVGLTSLATGMWPNRHAVTSWFMHLPGIDGLVTILPFVRTRDGKPLESLGVRPETAFPSPSMLGGLRRDSVVIQPRTIAGSTYSAYWAGGSAIRAYEDARLDEAVDIALDRAIGAGGPSFTYLYWNQPDKAAHRSGAASGAVLEQLRRLDRGLEEMGESLDGHCRIVLSTDHGHLDVADHQVHIIEPQGELGRMLAGPPGFDARVMFFSVRNACRSEFTESFAREHGDGFLLLSIDDVEALELFGPGRIGAAVRERMGDFVAISSGPSTIWYGNATDRIDFRGNHSGLSPEEMQIPLVIV